MPKFSLKPSIPQCPTLFTPLNESVQLTCHRDAGHSSQHEHFTGAWFRHYVGISQAESMRINWRVTEEHKQRQQKEGVA